MRPVNGPPNDESSVKAGLRRPLPAERHNKEFVFPSHYTAFRVRGTTCHQRITRFRTHRSVPQNSEPYTQSSAQSDRLTAASFRSTLKWSGGQRSANRNPGDTILI